LKKAIAIFFTIPLVLCLAGLSFARMGGMHRAMEEMGYKQVAGVVESVDEKETTATIKGMNEIVTVTLNNRTVIKMGDESKTFADLKAGDKVTVSYEVSGGKNMAQSIFISLPTEKNAEPEKPMEKK
jgi:Cu/Ag efflux protein CusF